MTKKFREISQMRNFAKNFKGQDDKSPKKFKVNFFFLKKNSTKNLKKLHTQLRKFLFFKENFFKKT